MKDQIAKKWTFDHKWIRPNMVLQNIPFDFGVRANSVKKRRKRKREEKKEKKKKKEGRRKEEKKSRYGIELSIICVEFVYGKYMFGTLV